MKPIYYLYGAWIVALTGLVGSLYFSIVRHLPPCDLCWYQRVAMYPLAVLLPLGIWLRDRYVTAYVLALSGIGAAIALYHTLLQYRVVPETTAFCTSGVSCANVQVEYFGFVTIPLLSLIAFILIFVSMVLANKAAR